MLALSDQLLAELDLEGATKAEATWRPDLVPPSLINDYSVLHSSTVVRYVSEVGRSNFETTMADVIAASKWQFGRRPVAYLPIMERILYRAVVETLRDQLPVLRRDNTTFQEFQNAPLTAAGATHVVTSDLSNFYSSIPTGRLANELVDRTGRWEPVEWLRKFWLSTADGHNGLPQVSQPSDIIAETYADELHRRILRRNVRAWRWADDFHMAATSQSDAYALLEVFDEEARKLGLTVNERKTQTSSLADYRKRIFAPIKRLREITSEVAADLTDFDSYSNEIIKPSDAEVQQGAAVAVLHYWRKERVEHERRFDIVAQMELAGLLRNALAVLEVLRDADAIFHCSEILRSDPQLTPQVARYLIGLATTEKEQVQDAIRSIVKSVPLNRWQRLWFLHLYANDAIIPIATDEPAINWIRSNLSDSSEVVRSMAAWALARNWSLKSDEWFSLTSRSTRLGNPWLAASLHTISGVDSPQRTTILSADRLDRDLYRWVGEWDPFPAPF